MCGPALDLELCALEAAVPFLRVSLSPDSFEREIERYRAELLDQAANESERSEVHSRLAIALALH